MKYLNFLLSFPYGSLIEEFESAYSATAAGTREHKITLSTTEPLFHLK